MPWLARAALALAVAASPAAAQTKPKTMIGDWRGSYVCPQGLTGLTLTIDKESGETFSGYFHFYPPPRNPVAKEGCYSVEGRRAADGRVIVGAVAWISRPPNYVTVDLAGRLGASGFSMAGDVVAPPGVPIHCERFELNWRNPRPAIADVCRGGVMASADLGDAAK